MTRISNSLVTAIALLAFCQSARAGVERVEIISRADVLDGKAFGDAGAYEKVVGKVHFKVDREVARNRLIVDLQKAECDDKGRVAFEADFYILRPKEAARSSGSVLLEAPNRGGKGILAVMQGGKGSRDPTMEEEFGDGFLMRRGVTVAWLGWQWDVRDEPNMMRLDVPHAVGPHDNSVHGLVRVDFNVPERVDEHPLGHLISGNIGGTEYARSDAEDEANVLTVRDGPFAQRQTIPRSEWEFVPRTERVRGSDSGETVEELRAIRLKGGFEPGKIYEVVYRAMNPAVAGLGFAALRDFASYLKQEKNELAPATKRVHALGISQSGRFLRHFLLEGFNADEAGKRAIDGMFIHVAGAGIGSFNHRFAQPSRDAQPTSALFYPTDLFPFTDAPQKEPETGKQAGLLDRYLMRNSAEAPHLNPLPRGEEDAKRQVRGGTGSKRARGDRAATHQELRHSELLPKIFHTNTSYEYWSRAGSLIHTSPDGKRDVAPVENARIYLLAGLQHFSRAFPPTPEEEPSLAAQHLPNPNPVRWFWRGLFVAMEDWVRDGKVPPESRYPKIADGTLVRREALKVPEIPVFRTVKEMSMRSLAAPPQRVHDALRLDFGPQWKNRIITKQPPGVGKPFPALVPQVNEDGNEVAGVRLPQLEVPLATYTGWNLRDPKIGMPNERVSFLGSFFPLPKTKGDAEAASDPRKPIAERYPSREEYLRKFEEAAAKLAAEGYLLEEDIGALVARGGEEWDYVIK